jgi:hypothetical protein
MKAQLLALKEVTKKVTWSISSDPSTQPIAFPEEVTKRSV